MVSDAEKKCILQFTAAAAAAAFPIVLYGKNSLWASVCHTMNVEDPILCCLYQ